MVLGQKNSVRGMAINRVWSLRYGPVNGNIGTAILPSVH